MVLEYAVVGGVGGVHVTGSRKDPGLSEVAPTGSKGLVQSELA